MLVLFAFIGFVGLIVLIQLVNLIDELIIELTGFPDQEPIGVPDQPEMPEEGEDVTDLLGSEELQIKNALFDEKIEQMRQEMLSKQAGVVYDEPHQVVESMYVPKPVHEYAE